MAYQSIYDISKIYSTYLAPICKKRLSDFD